MAPSPGNELFVEMSDFSDSSPIQGLIRSRGSPAPTSSFAERAISFDETKYTDADVQLLHQIVLRAEVLMTTLSPSSRLPTHALFRAHRETLPEYGLDPEEDKHILALVFKVGGIKEEKSIMDKFKTLMKRSGVTIAIDDLPNPGTDDDFETENSDLTSGHHSDSDHNLVSGVRRVKPADRTLIHAKRNSSASVISSDSTKSRSDDYLQTRARYVKPPGAFTESMECSYEFGPDDANPGASILEQQLEKSAIAFRDKYRVKFSAVSALRRWQSKSFYIDNICGQLDNARQADLEDNVEDKLNIWRSVSAKVEEVPPPDVPVNAYSKRIEGLAIRTHQIFSTKNALAGWRQSARGQGQKAEVMQRKIERVQDDFTGETNEHLARLAQRAYRNLVLSRALTEWSNRAEEESEKAQMAVKIYELNLKSKALGLRNRSTVEGHAATAEASSGLAALASKLASRNAAALNKYNTPSPNVDEFRGTVPTVPGSSDGKLVAVIHPQSHGSHGFRGQLENCGERNDLVEGKQLSTDDLDRIARGSVTTQLTIPPKDATAPALKASGGITISASTRGVERDSKTAGAAQVSAMNRSAKIGIVSHDDETDDADDSFEEMDERTRLARRHVLRMRFFGAWEKYTAESKAKVAEFEAEQQSRRMADAVPLWREQATSKKGQILSRNAQLAYFYNRITTGLPVWREKAQVSVDHEEQVLEQYAERADYYHKTSRALPLLRKEMWKDQEREGLLRYYADRAEFFSRTTKIIPIWRARAREATEADRLQVHYGERADYYYKTHSAVLEWSEISRQRRKDRLKEAYLETRRVVKKSMARRCIRQWREMLEPDAGRFELLDAKLEEVVSHREWEQITWAFDTWRRKAQDREDSTYARDATVKQKTWEQWRKKMALQQELQMDAQQHWEGRAQFRALKKWNTSSVQIANRPSMVNNALEKKERRLLRQGLEGWYSRTADKLVPSELSDGTYKSVNQVMSEAQQQAAGVRARGLLHTWKRAVQNKGKQVEEEAYAATPGRPQIMLGSLGRRETTTPLAPVPSRAHWQGRDSILGRPETAGRPGRSIRPKRNLRVSWAA